MSRRSYDAIKKQIAKLQAEAAKLEAVATVKKRKSVAQVLALMKKLDVSLEDLAASKPRGGRATKRVRASSSQKSVSPKYRDAQTGETWSGRGRTPRWLANLEAQGRSREEYRI